MTARRGLLAVVVTISIWAAGFSHTWFGNHQTQIVNWTVAMAQPATAPAPSGREPLYYRDPSGKPFYAASPRKDAQGRDFIAVYEDASTPSVTPAPMQSSTNTGAARIIIFYRHPMGLPDTSPVPKKDSMGMDYIPVYQDASSGPAGTVTVSPERVQMLGVRTEIASRRPMTRSIRAVGTIAIDERRLVVVAPRFEGWIERLSVNTTGQSIRRGQPLFDVYSPELALAEQEFLIARQSGTAIAEAAMMRLQNYALPADEITRLKRSLTASRTFALDAPIDGVVLDKPALAGMHFRAGDMLFRIADLSTVWVLADIFEQDLAQARVGGMGAVRIAAYPDRSFIGPITFIYPIVNPTTRTAKLRIELANPDQLLKPDMYATVEIAAPVGAASVIAVPDSAVLDNGTRQVVLVERAVGRFEPRSVSVGHKVGGYIEILTGLEGDEKIVVGANFLIDAESNLRAALQSFTAPPTQAAPPERRP